MSHQPFDRIFKTLAEEDVRAFLWLFGNLSVEPGDEVKALPRERHLPALAVDHAYLVEHQGRQTIYLFEAKARYQAEGLRQTAEYAVTLALEHRLRVDVAPVLVLFSERRAPERIEDRFAVELGAVRIEVKVQVRRLWEVEAGAVLEKEWPVLWPWTALMKAEAGILERAAERIAGQGDRRLAVEFVTLGQLRYDRSRLEKLLGQLTMFIPQELIEESPFYKEAQAKGRSEGEAKGRADEARRLLRHLLALKFPALEHEPSIDVIQDAGALEAIFAKVFAAADEESARRALSG